MILIADGDMIRNEVQISGERINPLPLDQDRYTKQFYGNKDFIINCINYLIDDSELMELRSRELKLRLLDRSRTLKHRLSIQLINTLLPVFILLLSGFIIRIFRRNRFSKGASDEVRSLNS